MKKNSLYKVVVRTRNGEAIQGFGKRNPITEKLKILTREGKEDHQLRQGIEPKLCIVSHCHSLSGNGNVRKLSGAS